MFTNFTGSIFIYKDCSLVKWYLELQGYQVIARLVESKFSQKFYAVAKWGDTIVKFHYDDSREFGALSDQYYTELIPCAASAPCPRPTSQLSLTYTLQALALFFIT